MPNTGKTPETAVHARREAGNRGLSGGRFGVALYTPNHKETDLPGLAPPPGECWSLANPRALRLVAGFEFGEELVYLLAHDLLAL